MRSTTSASPRLADTTPREDDRNVTAAATSVSLPRLYLFRLGYLVVAVGLALTKWPLLINHDRPWPLFEGVETCMLVALSLLAFLGLRYPLQMLPILLFELAWKFIWVAVVVLPLWISDRWIRHFECVLFLLVVLIVLCRHSPALCGRALRAEEGRSLAPDRARTAGDRLDGGPPSR